MLLAVSSSLGKSRTLTDAARELSLHPSYFPAVENLRTLMKGKSRRLVMLAEDDLRAEVADCLGKITDPALFGLIICADREALRSSDRAEAVQRFEQFGNVEWLDASYDIDALTAAARQCRRRMLRVEKDVLENAIAARELFLQYQPKVHHRSSTEWQTCEAEALIRWRHPEHGFLGPLEFLPEAEDFGLAGAIGDFVLGEAAAQVLKWREQSLDLNCCINLASSQLNDRELPERYQRIVQGHGLACAQFTFEISEQDLADSEATHLKVLLGLRNCGFRIALDDVRVAASSLGTFEELPFDEIKIHASALVRAQGNPVSQKVLAAVTALARNLGIAVCVEGIEDLATYDLLNTIECDKLQGFLISESVLPDIMRRAYNVQPDRKMGLA